jgi:hypothetical protein
VNTRGIRRYQGRRNQGTFSSSNSQHRIWIKVHNRLDKARNNRTNPFPILGHPIKRIKRRVDTIGFIGIEGRPKMDSNDASGENAFYFPAAGCTEIELGQQKTASASDAKWAGRDTIFKTNRLASIARPAFLPRNSFRLSASSPSPIHSHGIDFRVSTRHRVFFNPAVTKQKVPPPHPPDPS